MADIEAHVDRCLFLNSTDPNEVAEAVADTAATASTTTSENTEEIKPRESKRTYSIFGKSPNVTPKRARRTTTRNNVENGAHLSVEEIEKLVIDSSEEEKEEDTRVKTSSMDKASKSKNEKGDENVPLAEKMRPSELGDYIGQEHIIGKNTVLRTLFERNTIPSMILWGPPGCGKTTLAHIIATHCKKHENMRFVKLSAAMSGINEVKEAVKVAKNELKFKRRTILFMDEIHRFNKLQQDIFLPHVESGIITLLGATTENPSFSLNSALLSRCRVVVLEKLSVEAVMKILERALPEHNTVMFENNNQIPDITNLPFIPQYVYDGVRNVNDYSYDPLCISE